MSAEDPKGPVILCWDGSRSASRSIEHAARILGERRSAIVLFAHVPVEAHGGVVGVLAGRPSPDAPIMGAADAEGVLEEGVRIAVEVGFEASGLRVEADRKTAEIIVETAKEQDAMLVVMGQRGRTGLKSTLLGLGSVAQQVLGTYGGAVLLVGPTPA